MKVYKVEFLIGAPDDMDEWEVVDMILPGVQMPSEWRTQDFTITRVEEHETIPVIRITG